MIAPIINPNPAPIPAPIAILLKISPTPAPIATPKTNPIPTFNVFFDSIINSSLFIQQNALFKNFIFFDRFNRIIQLFPLINQEFFGF
jgi:hypothetical protein